MRALNGYGRCLGCGVSYGACPGVYHCDECEPCAVCENEDCDGCDAPVRGHNPLRALFATIIKSGEKV